MPDNITFKDIPIGQRVPGAYLEIDPSRAVRGLPQIAHKMLVISQRLSTGIIAEGLPVRITRKEDGINYFGRGSMLAQMIAASLEVNPYNDCGFVRSEPLYRILGNRA